VDDILDYSGEQAALGKPVGGDLRQGIVTLPFFYYLQGHPEPEQVLAALNGAGESGDAVSEIISQVRRSGAIESAAAEAVGFAASARGRLASFPQGPYRQALEELADFVVSRHV